MTKTDVIKYNVTDSAIEEVSKKYMSLKLNGVDDKEGYSKIVEYKKEVRGKRLEVEATRKTLKADSIAWGKKVDAEAKRITLLLAPIEAHLTEQENIVKKEKERIAEKERVEFENKILARIKRVISCGAVFNGVMYVYGDKMIKPIDIREFSDSEMNDLFEKIALWSENEALEIAAKKKSEEEEADRQAKIKVKQEAEQLRLDNIAKEQAAEKKKLEDEKKTIADEKAKMAEDTKSSRVSQLNLIGLIYDHNAQLFLFEDVNVSMAGLKTMDNARWDTLIQEIVPAIKDRKDRAAEAIEATEKRVQARQAEMLKAGASFDGVLYTWPGNSVLSVLHDTISQPDDLEWTDFIAGIIEAMEKQKQDNIKAHQEAEEKAEEKRLADIKTAEDKVKSDAKLAEKKKAEEEKKAEAKAERVAKLAPDKEKLFAYAEALLNVPTPELKNQESKDFFWPIQKTIEEQVALINERTKPE